MLSFNNQRKVPLYLILTVQFTVQVIAIVSLVVYPCYRTAKKAVEQLADELMTEQGNRIEEHLDSYLGKAQEINYANTVALQTQLLDINDFETIGKYFYKQVQVFDFGFINFGGEDGSFIASGYVLGKEAIIAEIPKDKIGVLSRYQVDQEGNRQKLLKVINNAQRNNMSWYTDAVKSGKAIWSSIYTWGKDAPRKISISASTPIYDNQKQLLGVLGIDIKLNQLS
ncbi:MAG: cache domain-containing protein, partial [Trichodesmium sp.]